MNKPPLAWIGGIPIRVDSSFLFGAVIIFLWTGGGLAGMYTIVAMAIFVLIHELGHALVARSFGAHSEVTMSFLGGYTSFSKTSTITRAQHIAISAAGAAAQLAVAVPTLWFALRWVSSAARESLTTGGASTQMEHAVSLYTAVSWAGILLAFLNLLPALPLDGGLIVTELLRPFTKERTDQIMRFWSLGVAGALLLAYLWTQAAGGSVTGFYTPQMLLNPSPIDMIRAEANAVGSFILGGSIMLPLFIGLGLLAQPRARHRVHGTSGQGGTHGGTAGGATPSPQQMMAAIAEAERRGWATGTIESFPYGAEPSPWLMAYAAERRGDHATANGALFALDDSRERRWVDPPDPQHPAIDAALSRLPESVAASAAVLGARVYAGTPEALAACATQRYAMTGDSTVLYLAAAGFAARSLIPDALAWASEAVAREPRVDLLETLPPFGTLRQNPDFEALVERARLGGH